MSLSDLTKGAVRRLNADDDPNLQPICQILSVKTIPTNAGKGPDRYRVILSDGEFYTQGEYSTAPRGKKKCADQCP